MQNTSKRASIILGVFMIVVLVAGAIVPLLTRSINTTQPQVQPTVAPTATFPPPPAPESISFDQLYLHPSGIFVIAEPEGWTPTAPVTEPGRAAVTMVNNDALSVIEAAVEAPNTPVTTMDELDKRYDDAYLQASWARYGRWEEAARRVEGDKLVLDFNLTLNQQTYVARQKSWTDGEWVYSVRVVAPGNASSMLVYVLNHLVDSVVPLQQFAGTPLQWVATYDTVADHVIRHPGNWTVQDAAPGGPTSIVGPGGIALRVDSTADTAVANENEAEDWLRAVRPNADILSVVPVQRGEAEGWSVAYADTTVDGDPQSGLAVLLNGPDGTLHTANLRFNADHADLNVGSAPVVAEATPEATAEATAAAQPLAYAELAEVMGTFSLLPPLNLISENATPTPLPPAAEVSEEASAIEAEATQAAATAEATEAGA